MEELLHHLESGPARTIAVTAAWVVGAWLAEAVVCRGLSWAASKTKSKLDDQVIAALRRPIFLSVLFMGLFTALDALVPAGHPRSIAESILKTLAILVWSVAALRVGSVMLEVISKREDQQQLLQARTLPIFNVAYKMTLLGLVVYFLCLAWKVDVTAWLASAGIVGIALGFAAQDSLANLFAGIFILADAPYKVGDFIVLDGDLRGQVIQIGMRSTRIVTRADIEVTIPNSVIGNSKIINETGGPAIPHRVGVAVAVSYESDVDRVREVLQEVTEGVPNLAPSRAPQVRFRSFGDSGLNFELLVWIVDAALRGQVLDTLNTRVYKAFAEAKIEIPYSKHDVYVKQLPGA